MAESEQPDTSDGERSVYRDYVLDVRIVSVERTGDSDSRYRFEAPEHVGAEFDDPDTAELYADVYFDTNGFQEEGTGERGVPPEVIQAGKDTVAAYFLTRPGVDHNWMASFYGVKPTKIDRYVSWVRDRAEEIREGVAERDLE
ncbi:hypothetical protein [Halorussus sp. MSC15.2]|uniref:hypothetical protein n=1 Tax=Halorussus sp. MSC15.2 TaxID=2283638 RepID=UPI0013D3D502|nr:hypothetical protein [Halorussus sp. MSC15.2]NEU56828.1 hypothetical protein [Halorussus sp. MSC15.2]